MKNEVSYASVKKILTIINSCRTDMQLENCKKTINDYIKLVVKKGVTNSLDLRDRLYKELEEREEALYLVEILN